MKWRRRKKKKKYLTNQNLSRSILIDFDNFWRFLDFSALVLQCAFILRMDPVPDGSGRISTSLHRRDGNRIFFTKTNIPHSGTWVNKLWQKIQKKYSVWLYRYTLVPRKDLFWLNVYPVQPDWVFILAFFVKAHLLMFLNKEYFLL